jgi:hypothetical protein
VVCFLTLGCKVITFLVLNGSGRTSFIEVTVLEFCSGSQATSGCCEQSNEASVCIKCGEFCD